MKKLIKILEERKRNLEKIFYNNLPIEKQHQIVGAISEINLTLKTLDYLNIQLNEPTQLVPEISMNKSLLAIVDR